MRSSPNRAPWFVRACARLALLAPLATAGCGREVVPTANASPSASASGSAARAPRRLRLDPSLEKRFGIRSERAGDPASLAGLSVPGTVEYDPDAYAEVGPRLDGRVVSLHARLGDPVRKGDLLAELVVPSLAETQAAVLVAQSSLLAATKNAEREHDLLSQQLTTAREVELADAELARVTVERDAAATRLRAVGADARSTGGILRLTAPLSGVVVQRATSLGAYLASSSNAYVVADTSKLVVALEIHEADLPYLALGAEVRFRTDGVPDRVFTGTLAHLDPAIGKTSRLVRARVAVPNPDGALRPGMFVRASIALARPESAGVLLPADAVQPLGVEDVAFVSRGEGAYELRFLEVGRRTPDLVEVLAGVSRGEAVVVDGAFLLRAEASKQ